MTIALDIKHEFPSVKREEPFRLSVKTEIPSDRLTVIFGESGSGKTSLLRLIAGLERATQGEITFRGKAWQSGKQFVPPYQRSLAYVFQEPSLFPHLNIRQNLEFAIKRCKKPAKPELMSELLELLGIDHLLQRDSSSLSGGEKQRIAICRALLSQPDLLLMDEPLSALDNKRKREFLPFLEKLKHELHIPIIYVTHSVNELTRLADELLVLDNGQVNQQGSLIDVLERSDLLKDGENDASVILEASIESTDHEWGIMSVRSMGSLLHIPQQDLPTSHPIRLRVMARDVSIALDQNSQSSIQNRISTTIEKIETLNHSHCLLTLINKSGLRLLASLTRKSVAELKLEAGLDVYAQIKSVAIIQ